jgi:Leucine-rich repeat (LRR) protein
MTTMNFSYCRFLNKLHDVSRIPNLETLYLDGSKNLVEVHCSVEFLDKLVDLSFDCCYNLRIFPRSFKLRSLERLVLGGCSRLKNFREIECQMERIEYVKFVLTGIEKLPSSIGYFVGIKILNLDGCTNLTNLPNSIHQLWHLEYLSLNGCTGIKELPSSIGHLARLKRLSLKNCTNLMNIPNEIYQLQHLEVLNLINCKQLREILEFLSNVQFVMAEGSVSLAIFLEVRR